MGCTLRQSSIHRGFSNQVFDDWYSNTQIEQLETWETWKRSQKSMACRRKCCLAVAFFSYSNSHGDVHMAVRALFRIELDIPMVECGLNGIASVEVY